jgi:MIP family channel proteins
MNDNFKAALAEFVGTFTLVFIGAGAGALAASTGIGTLGVALAHGIALMVIVYAWGSVSGAHVNPAVTFGLAVAGKIDWLKAVYYWIAQFLGAVVAAYLLAWLLGATTAVAGLGATVGSLTASDSVKTVAVEAVLTFFLVTAVFGSAVAGRNGSAAGLAIGFVLAMDILMGGSLTGGSMNPARTFGPALATGHLDYFWMYLLGPALGAAAAGLLFDQVFLPKPTPKPAPAPAKPARRVARK